MKRNLSIGTRVRIRFLLLAALSAGGVAQPAFARLGTFNNADGYQHLFFPPGTSYNWSDVTYYNAGENGANAGGGAATFIPHNTGNRWQLVSSLGAFFSSAALRNASIGTYPPYPIAPPPSDAAAYMVGAHFPGRNNDGRNLAFRNDTPTGTGPVIYDYYLDSYDMGVNPATVTSGNVATSFYFLPTYLVPTNPGARSPDKFHLSFMDTAGNIGFQWGYAQDNEVYWRTNTSGPWNYTGVYAEDQGQFGQNNLWDGIDVNIDLSNDTFGIDYYDVGTNTWSNLVPAGTPLGTSMQDFTRLRWQLEDGGGTPFAGKNYFDDFTFTVVPEPSSIILFGLTTLGLVNLRTRRNAG